jgi:hypothetical protein
MPLFQLCSNKNKRSIVGAWTSGWSQLEELNVMCSEKVTSITAMEAHNRFKTNSKKST